MKKTLSALLAGILLITLSACDNNSSENITETSQSVQTAIESKETTSTFDFEPISETTNQTTHDIASITQSDSDIHNLDSIDVLEDKVLKDVENTIETLNTEWENLSLEINTYDKYLEDAADIESFYNTINETTRLLCVRMYEYTLQYAKIIMSSDSSNDDKYNDFEDLYDCIYDGAGDELYDEIYDGILDDMYDAFYTGILDDAYDNAPYDEWSDARSDEYDWWSDTRSDVYDNWSDLRSDVYNFWSDMRSELWDDEIEKAEEKLTDFQKDVEKIKNN